MNYEYLGAATKGLHLYLYVNLYVVFIFLLIMIIEIEFLKNLILLYLFGLLRWLSSQFLLLGAVPFPKDVPRLRQLGVGGVITLNEPYETLVPTSLYYVRYICTPYHF